MDFSPAVSNATALTSGVVSSNSLRCGFKGRAKALSSGHLPTASLLETTPKSCVSEERLLQNERRSFCNRRYRRAIAYLIFPRIA